MLTLVLTAQASPKAWPNNTYMPVNTNALPGSDESEHMIDSASENASSRVWNATHNYTMSDDTRSKCFDHFEDYEAPKYPNEYSYQNGYSSGGGNFESCGDSDTWAWGGDDATRRRYSTLIIVSECEWVLRPSLPRKEGLEVDRTETSNQRDL
jgi:hypothetical protein